jgi:hypothetical protein
MRLTKKDVEKIRLAQNLLVELTAYLLLTEKKQRKMSSLPIAKEVLRGVTPKTTARRALRALGSIVDKSTWRKAWKD